MSWAPPPRPEDRRPAKKSNRVNVPMMDGSDKPYVPLDDYLALEAERDALREEVENWRNGMIEQSTLRHAAEAGWSRGEHQAEARAVEAHQEEKHCDA